jgi:hypothetical protein
VPAPNEALDHSSDFFRVKIKTGHGRTSARDILKLGTKACWPSIL